MEKVNVGFAMCGSFCTFKAVIPEIKKLVDEGYNVYPVMSPAAYTTDTRFGKSKDFIEEIEKITDKKIIHTIFEAEPIGPKKLFDVMVIAPCTGNTIGKLAGGIFDTSVTLGAKAHLRNQRPLIIAVSTNDALSGSAKNIGTLMSKKDIYFVPMRQDDPKNKPRSVVADFTYISETVKEALKGNQIQPIYL